MPDLATLGLQVERQQVEHASRALDTLAQKGGMAGDMARRLKADFASGAISADQLAAGTAKLAPAMAKTEPEVNRLTQAIQRMRVAAQQSGADAMATQIAKLDPFARSGAAAISAVGHAGHGTAMQMAMLRSQLAGIAATSLALPGIVGRLGSALGGLALNANVLFAAIGSITVLALAFQKVRQPFREFAEGLKAAREHADQLRESLRATLFLEAELIQLEVEANRRRLASVPRQGAGAGVTIAGLEARIAEDELRIAALRKAAWEDTMRQIDEAAGKRQTAIDKELQGIRGLQQAESERFVAAENALVRQARLAEQARLGITPQAGEFRSRFAGVLSTINVKEVGPGRFSQWWQELTDREKELARIRIQIVADTISTISSMAQSAIRGEMTLAGFGAGIGGLVGRTDPVMGAAIEGVTGFMDALFGAGEAARRAAQRLKEFNLTLDQVRAEVTGNVIAQQIAAVRAQFEQLRQQAMAANPAGFSAMGAEARDRLNAERNRVLAELNALEAERIQQIQDEARILAEDVQVRLLRATGHLREAEASAFALAQERELTQARKNGADEATLTALREAQLAEARERAADLALAATRAEDDLRLRMLQAQGLDTIADAYAFALAQQREYEDAVRSGADATYLAQLQEVQLAEARQRSIALLQEQLNVAQTALTGTLRVVQSLKEFSTALQVENATPGDQVSLLRAQFEDVVAQARMGNQDVAQRVPELARQFLAASRTYNASGLGYQSDLAYVQGVVKDLIGTFDEQASYQQQIVDLLREQIRVQQQMLEGVYSWERKWETGGGAEPPRDYEAPPQYSVTNPMPTADAKTAEVVSQLATTQVLLEAGLQDLAARVDRLTSTVQAAIGGVGLTLEGQQAAQ